MKGTFSTRKRRFLLFFVASLVVLAAAGLLVLHTVPVRTRVAARLVRYLDERYAITAEVSGIHYNLLTLEAELRGIRLAARSHPSTPFLQVESLRLNVSWSAVWSGAFSIESLEAERAQIRLARPYGGSWNLPAMPDAAGEDVAPLPIGRFVAHDVAVTIEDEVNHLSANLTHANLDLRPATHGIAGPLNVITTDGTALARIDYAAIHTIITDLAATVSFDGATLALRDVRLEAPEARVRGTAELGLLVANPRVDATSEAEIHLKTLDRWMQQIVASQGRRDIALKGTLHARGEIRGPLHDPAIELKAAGDDLAWSTVESISVQARTRLTREAIALDELMLRLAGGSVHGMGRVALDGTTESTVSAEWRDVDVLPLVSAAMPGSAVLPDASARGRLDARWRELSARGMDVTIENILVAAPSRPRVGVRPSRLLPLEGRTRFVTRNGRWTLDADERIARSLSVRGALEGEFPADDYMQSPLRGRMHVDAEEIGRVTALVPGLSALEPVRGAVTGRFDVSGTIHSPRSAGIVESNDLVVRQFGPSAVHLRLDVDRQRLRVATLEGRAGENSVTAEGSLTFVDVRRPLDGRFRASLANVTALLPSDVAALDPRGLWSIEGRLGGTVARPIADAEVSAADLQIAGQHARELTARVRVDGADAVIDTLEIAQDEGRVTLTGRYNLTRQQFTVNGRARALRVDPIIGIAAGGAVDVGARVNADLRAWGTLAAPAVVATMQAADVEWGARRFGEVSSRIQIEGRTARVDAAAPQIHATLTGHVGLDAPHTAAADMKLEGADLGRLAAMLAPERWMMVAGTTSLAITAQGDLDRLSDASLVVDLRQLEGTLQDRPIRLVRSTRVTYTNALVGAGDLELRVGDAALRANGSLGAASGTGSLSVTLAGDLSDIQALELVNGLTGSGPIHASATVTGTVTRPVIAGDLAIERASVGWKNYPAVTGIQLTAAYRQGQLVFERAVAEWQHAQLSATGSLPARLFDQYLPQTYLQSLGSSSRTATFKGRLMSLTPALASPFVEPELMAKLEGHAAAAFEVTASSLEPRGITGSLDFDELALTLAGVPIQQRQPTRFTIADARVRIVDWNWGAEENELRVSGSTAFTGDRQLDVTLAGSLDLRAAAVLLPPGLNTGGRAAVDVRIHGSLADPLAEGELRLVGGEAAVPEPRLAITDVNGRVALSRDRAVFENVSGTANGGRVRISGFVAYPHFTLTDGQITAAGEGIALEWPEGLKTEIDATLALALGVDTSRLTGTVTVLRGSHREIVSLPGIFAALRNPTTTASPGRAPSFLDRLTLGVTVVTRNDIHVDNNYGRVDLGADLRIVGTPTQPGLSGRAVIREGGEVYLAGRTYYVEVGTIDFVSPSRIEPDMRITARTRAAGTDVRLDISGTLDTLSVDLTSDNSDLSQPELTSLLLTGRTSFAGETAGVAREQLLTLLSGELFGVAGRAIGLDTLRIDRGFDDPEFRFDPGLVANEIDPGSRLTFSKQFSREFELIFSQSLRESGSLTWIGAYHVRNNLELRVVSRDNRDRSYEFRHDTTFGGSRTARPRVRPGGPRAPAPRIRDILFTGTPGVDRSALGAKLSLQPGDRFDYYAWQEDRERLLAYYRTRGYLEARVVGQRRVGEGAAAQGSADQSVTLAFAITPGPRTTLEFAGYRPPATVRRQLEDAWTRSVFDSFLREEMKTVLQAHLASIGYLRPSIDVGVTKADDAAKTIRLRVDTGPRTTERQIDVTGNRAISTTRLIERLQQNGTSNRAWLDPAAAARDLESLYRAQGWLRATARHQGPEIQPDGGARLVFTIDEGPRFRVAHVTFDGVARASDTKLRTRAAIQPGDFYAAARLEGARSAIDIAYREQGFNDVRVSHRSDVRMDLAEVDITFTVQEGARQVLGEVRINGAVRTKPDFVRRALELEVGTPVNLVEWYRARKRLYDTGVFRRADVRLERIDAAQAASGDDPVRALVEVEEWPPVRLQYGLQVLDEEKPESDTRQFGLGLAGDLTHRNLFGRAASGGLSARYTRDAQIGRAFARVPRFFGLPISSNLFASQSHQRRQEPGLRPLFIDLTDITAEQRVRPWSTFEVAYGASFRHNHTFRQPDPDDPIPFDLVLNVGRVSATGLFDTRNDLVNPSRGWYHSSSLDYGAEFDSALRFVRYFGQGAYYRQFGRRVIVATGARIGLATAFGNELLPGERFYAGGARSVRGYAEDSLGPLDILGFPAGGQALLVLNEEVRVAVYRQLSAIGFFDAGSTFTSPARLSLRDLKRSVGFGVRVASPVGLLGVDAGFPTPRLVGQPRLRWSFLVGQTF